MKYNGSNDAKGENGWVLDIIPDREEVIEQMNRTGLETMSDKITIMLMTTIA
ncbi:MAG: hypothetical protein ACXQS5_07085 [Candidatus Methanospirareceae archaeon]